MIARLREQGGFTLMELLIASSLMIVVLGATLTVFEQFVSVGNRNTNQNSAQDTARTTIDQVARQLRNLALPTPQNPNSIDIASSYDLVFKTADPGRRRVRYCLQTTSPYSTSNGALWLETQTGTAGGADPPLPDTSTCPVPPTSGGWTSERLVASNVTNENGGANRPIFEFNAPTTSLTKITEVHVSLFVDVDPASPPTETRISTGVFLRNQNQAPSAAFSVSIGGTRRFLMNAANSSDPEGRTLAYYWFLGTSPSFTNAMTTGACDASDGCVNTGVLNDYTLSSTASGSQVFTLLVKDPGGLTATASTTCTQSGSSWTCSAPQGS